MTAEPRWFQWWLRSPRNDASTIMGMQTRAVYILAAALLSVFTVVGFTAGGVTVPLLYLLAMLVLAGVALVLLAAPGDPMHPWGTAVAAVGPTVALLIALPGLSTRPGMANATLMGTMAIILAFLCVRGRVWAAWGGFWLGVIVSLLADRFAGPQPTLLAAIPPNLAVMLMATFFATIVRPRARQIYALRGQTEREAAARAADQAVLAVRDQQLAYLDQRARPLLELIADGRDLDDGIVTECALVEAALRDRIRAPGLDTPEITGAAWAARSRGARVLLLDDHTGSGSADVTDLLGAVRRAAVQALDEADGEHAVTIRILPPGRTNLATVTVVDSAGPARQEFGPDGRRLTASAPVQQG